MIAISELRTYYTTFARNYPKERTEVVQKFIAELAPCAKQAPVKPVNPTPVKPSNPAPAKPQPTTPPPVATSQTAPASTHSPGHTDTASSSSAPSSPGRGLRLSGIAVAGLGVAAVGAGVYFGLSARSKSKDLNSSPTWEPALERNAKAADRNAKITLAVGGAAIIGGAVLYYLGHRASQEHAPVAVVPAGDGGSIVWFGAF
ncbi:MAG: hypothetical protein AB7O24_31035 [Kofleriaceae bacterium]